LRRKPQAAILQPDKTALTVLSKTRIRFIDGCSEGRENNSKKRAFAYIANLRADFLQNQQKTSESDKEKGEKSKKMRFAIFHEKTVESL